MEIVEISKGRLKVVLDAEELRDFSSLNKGSPLVSLKITEFIFAEFTVPSPT